MQPSFVPFSLASVRELEEQFSTSNINGLSEAQRRHQLTLFGRNILSHGKETVWTLLARQFRSVFVWLLFFAAGLSFFLGEHIDAMLIVVFILFGVVLSFYQEYKSENILQALKKYFVSRATVIRDGKQEQIMSTELVPGDVVIVEPGDIIPADVRFIEAINLSVDEGLLTGESRAVEKRADLMARAPTSLFEARNIGFSATHVISGMGRGIVIATGSSTAAGSTAKLATDTKHVSGFEASMNQFSVFMLRLVVGTLFVLFVLHYLIKGPDVQIGELLIFFVALAVSVVPEALPVVFTFALSSGAAHLAKRKVVVKRLTSIEDLGSIDILCTDKTGTITQGVMSLAAISAGDGETLAIARLGIPDLESVSNPFDHALINSTQKVTKLKETYTSTKHIGFDPKLRFDSTLLEGKSSCVIFRGAPEAVIMRCKVDSAKRREILSWIEQEGRFGRRVLGIAQRVLEDVTEHWSETSECTFVGMLSFEDPLKPTSIKALEKARSLGIQIKILTGDRAEVAGAIAQQLSLITNPDDVITGDTLFALAEGEQLAAVKKYDVFARVSPENKLMIIRLLKQHARVGFLGEGINDAPALKEAQVGIVVQNASDVARESADIVLLEKNLLVILEGVAHGRKVSANVLKYIKTTLASNFGNFYSVAIASLFIPYLPMLSIQILLVNLLSDFPMIAIAGDAVEEDELTKPKGMDMHEMGFVTTFFGVVSSVFDFLLFAAFVPLGAALLQTAWFVQSILTELLAIFSLRTRRWFFLARAPGKMLSVLVVGAMVTTLALPSFEVTRKLFSFAVLSTKHYFIIGGILLGYFVATEFTKHLYYRSIETQKN